MKKGFMGHINIHIYICIIYLLANGTATPCMI